MSGTISQFGSGMNCPYSGKIDKGVMTMGKPLVKCSVANCEYWAQGNRCDADLIMIEVDKHANARFSEEFAGESFDEHHKDSAISSRSTCCHTFKPKKPQ
jgi:hypothetical protein